MEIRLDGKTAIVTGSRQGIGRVCAEQLAKAGAAVVINSHQESAELDEVAQGIANAGGNVKAVAADVTDREQAQKLVDAALELGGSIDILVNNAGGLVKRVPVSEFDSDHYEKVMDINLKTAFLMSHRVIEQMKKQQSGKIINLSSQAAHDGGGPGSAAYSATKGAILTFTKSLAKELGPDHIHVNSVSPGFIAQTEFHDTHTAQEVHDTISSRIPLRRKGVPMDVAHAVLFLASGLTDYITGQTIEVNGGLYMY
jgi:3-oxoacyl-[acyl-carrier protein] reductase